MDAQAKITLMLAGDVMIGRSIDQVLKVPSLPGLYASFVWDARDYIRLVEVVNGPIPALAFAFIALLLA